MATPTPAAHPASYTAYAFTEPGGDLQKITVDWRDPHEGEVVLKVLACGVCATDNAIVNGTFPVPLPRIPGHEIVGDVVAVGPNEKLWAVGDRVGVGCHGGFCAKCKRCRVGDFVTCEEQGLTGILMDGGYAEYATVRSQAVAAIPKDLDPAEVAPLLCAGVTTFNGLRKVDLLPGEVVAIQGIGGLGHLAVQFAHAMGHPTIALSSSAAKGELALRLGAVEYADGSQVDQAAVLQKHGGAKLIMCTASAPEATKKLIPGLAVDGTLLLLAVSNEEFGVSPMALLRQRFSIKGLPHGLPMEIEECVAFAKLHNIKAMVERFPLAQTPEASRRRESARFRAVIVP
ncbi:GroES-like protein [Trametes versicolor FP-101664 SS1]|uniref:GroES-like protein n=1 Tax=Trametes versicolor (strain FP-101664) TaxID=717944 RepID=UPI0004622A50|nr:GroES-like protein [Trametes versicolor FP-101664 SS1]EIW63877.1 GroES-like protein [Trametes versicolor FP-101664 SS1]